MTNLLIVDDSDFIKSLLSSFFNDDSEINLVGCCSDGDEVIPFLMKKNVDVILMDIMMKRVNGDDATKLVSNLFPDIKVIAFSSEDDHIKIKTIMNNGAKYFINKNTHVYKIAEIIKTI